jgi:hypothetical protein
MKAPPRENCLVFSPPDQAANAQREKEELERKEKARYVTNSLPKNEMKSIRLLPHAVVLFNAEQEEFEKPEIVDNFSSSRLRCATQLLFPQNWRILARWKKRNSMTFR